MVRLHTTVRRSESGPVSGNAGKFLSAFLGLRAPDAPKIRVLDVFSGTGSVSKVCKLYPNMIDVTSVDMSDEFSTPTHKCNVLGYDYKKEAGFDIIFASPDCTHYSRSRTTGGPRDLKSANRLVLKTQEIILWFLAKNRKLIWFMENPATGLLVTPFGDYEVPFVVTGLQYIINDYCMFSNFGYKKHTAFFTNLKDRGGALCSDCGNKVGSTHRKTVEGCPREQKYKIPAFLIHTLLFKAMRQLSG